MKASRLAVAGGGKTPRWAEISDSGESCTRRSKDSITSSKNKKSNNEPSSSRSRNKHLSPVVRTKIQAAEDTLILHATTTHETGPYEALDYDWPVNSQNLPNCPWPNWSEWGHESMHEEGGGAAAGPMCSYSISSFSSSDSESDDHWCSTSSSTRCSTSTGNRAHEPREIPKTCQSLGDFIWGERKSWRKLKHKRSFLTNVWYFKPETKVEEGSEPILVSVTVMGSPGPLRLVVDKNDSVQHTVDFALRRYTAQKRQPELLDPTSCFGLYCRNPDFEALDDEAKIGHRKNRQFHVYQKQHNGQSLQDIAMNDVSSCKSGDAQGLAPARSWIWNKINRMSSLVREAAASISRCATFWVKYLNPRRFYRFIYIASVRALS